MINLNSHILQSTIVGKTIGICLVFCFASCSQQNEKIFMGKVKNQIKVEYSGNSIIIRSLDENGKEEKDNTIITSHFNYDKDIVGQIGIIGLTRIDYKEVISDIKLISDLLSK